MRTLILRQDRIISQDAEQKRAHRQEKESDRLEVFQFHSDQTSDQAT